MKGVIYARYSSDNQREESIDGQLRECKEFADKNGIEIIGEYIDRALSAKTDNRPEFQKMIKDSYRKLFDTIIVWKVDRFARNRYDSAHYKHLLKKNGVKVVSAREHISEGAEGIILESMLEGYAEYYSVELTEKVNRGLMENALKGKLNGGTIPLGYRLTKEQTLEINEETAPVVLEIFTRYNDGEQIKSIEKDLALRGLTNNYGGPITYNRIHYLLKNRRYIGEYRFRDVVHKNAFPAIVPEDLFNSVQKKLEKNKIAPARNKAEDEYILTTKLKCGKCGAYMVGESGKSMTGAIHRYYKCANTKKKKLCNKKSVKKAWIDDLVVQKTMNMIMDDKLVEKIADRIIEILAQENTTIPKLQAKLKETEKYIDNMLTAIQQGLINVSAKKRLDELEETKKEIETAILAEKLQKPEITKEHIRCFFNRFKEIDVKDIESRKKLIDSFVNSVYVYDDKILITFNYKDGTKEISLEEVSDETSSDLEKTSPPKAKGLPKAVPLFLVGVSE